MPNIKNETEKWAETKATAKDEKELTNSKGEKNKTKTNSKNGRIMVESRGMLETYDLLDGLLMIVCVCC